MSKYITISLVVIFFVLGTGLGYVISPQYSMSQYESKQMVDLGKADKYVDLRYINAMIAHHKGAMKLAEQVKYESQRQDIKILAVAILTDEPKAIDELYQWKKDWYNDTTEVASMEVPNLGTYDEKLDWRFLNALITHHESGIEMTMEIQMKSTRNEILSNANAVQAFLTKGVKMLVDWRTSWYEVK
jgi:uncharacterized protein (DUF305 family)